MQDRYAGDIGDFGKFSLLRHLFNTPKHQTGVVWYLFPNESHNGDGRHIEYLNQPDFQFCDDYLIERLSHTVNNQRTVKSLEDSKLLPSTTIYHSTLLDSHIVYPGQTVREKLARQESRSKWLEDAIIAVSECNVVFLDPDNGLEIPSLPQMNRMTSGKFAYYSEVSELFKGKNACVIYHHLNRNCAHDIQIKQRVNELRNKVSIDGTVFVLRYAPYSPRAFFILTNKSEASSMRSRLQEFMASPCGNGWDSYYEG